MRRTLSAAGWLTLAQLMGATLACEAAPYAPPHPTVEIAAPTAVPPPFEPVAVHRASSSQAEAGPEIAVWGRRYVFTQGPLPTRLTSQGVDLWAQPPRFQAGTSGEAKEVTWSAPVIDRTHPGQVVLRSEGRAAGIRAAARTTVEYDGMIRVDLQLTAEANEIGSFAYELSFPSEVARHFNHHLEYDYTHERVDRTQLPASAGIFPVSPRRLLFVPTVFVGNREVGVEWWSETNAGWNPAPGDEPLELRTAEGVAQLRIAPIARTVSLPRNTAWTHTFAIFPAPTREPPPRWRSYRFGSPSQARRFEGKAGNRQVWIAFPTHFDARWHGLPESDRSERQRELRADLAKDAIAYIPYGKLTVAPSLNPEAMKQAESWASSRRLFTSPGGGERKFLEARGWKRGTPYSYGACLEAPGYLDWMLRENLTALRTEKLDGLYFDVASIREPCRKKPYVRNPREQRWSYFALREFYKQLYAAVKAENPEALLTVHSLGQPRAMASFIDYLFVGEALNILFRSDHTAREVQQSPELYDPDYFGLPEGFLDAMILPRVGGVTSLIPQIRRGNMERTSELLARRTRELLAIVLVNDMHVWLTNSHPKTRIEIFRAVDRFGNLDDARLEPWWTPTPAITHDPRLRVTAYRTPGRALLVVANWERSAIRSRIGLDLDALGLASATRVRDLESPRTKADSLRKGSFDALVPGQDFRLYLIE